jgi:D-beta-D-heptose 7-phosphate kinase/D-beta-D-heptose 1-phosphate adenosyltransferase
MTKKILVNGTFDILHVGHIHLLNYAKSLGDHLTVAIDSDTRVKSLKGSTRPINSQFERRVLLENLKAVDQVVIFENDQQLVDIIANCSIMVKGSDYKDQPIVGQDVCSEIVFFERLDEYSSTKKIQHIANR